MNCTKEESLKLVEKFGKREWERIKKIEFPITRSIPITEKQMISEFNNLKKKDLNWKTNSKIVNYFNHDSLIRANKVGRLSPYDFWQRLRTDFNLFCTFLENRYRCSDWYKEKDNMKYLEVGYVPEEIYGVGIWTSSMSSRVGYFKPAQMKYLIKNYADEFNTIFDPFAGFAGRMLGTVACCKKYIGQDISDLVIKENKKCTEFLKALDSSVNVELSVKDTFKDNGEYDCLITCPPYTNKRNKPVEEWRKSDGSVITCDLTCDEIIDYCLENYKCKKYVFVVDDSIQKYRGYIVDKFENVNYIQARNNKLTDNSFNYEAIVVIEK